MELGRKCALALETMAYSIYSRPSADGCKLLLSIVSSAYSYYTDNKSFFGNVNWFMRPIWCVKFPVLGPWKFSIGSRYTLLVFPYAILKWCKDILSFFIEISQFWATLLMQLGLNICKTLIKYKKNSLYFIYNERFIVSRLSQNYRVKTRNHFGGYFVIFKPISNFLYHFYCKGETPVSSIVNSNYFILLVNWEDGLSFSSAVYQHIKWCR